MNHLGRADAVDDADAGVLEPLIAGRARQVFAGGDAGVKRSELALVLLHQCAVASGRGEERRGLVLGDGVDEDIEAGLGADRSGGADARREDDAGAEAEGEGQRRRADEDIGGCRPQHVTRECFRHRRDVTMKMHATLRLAGGAGGERDQRGIVASRGDGGVLSGRVRHAMAEFVGRDDVLQCRRIGTRLFEFGDTMCIDDGVRNLRLVEDHRQFVRAKHRHCVDRYAAGAPDAPPHRH